MFLGKYSRRCSGCPACLFLPRKIGNSSDCTRDYRRKIRFGAMAHLCTHLVNLLRRLDYPFRMVGQVRSQERVESHSRRNAPHHRLCILRVRPFGCEYAVFLLLWRIFLASYRIHSPFRRRKYLRRNRPSPHLPLSGKIANLKIKTTPAFDMHPKS